MTAPDFLFDGPEAAAMVLALAHGAGQPADSPFMTAFARGLAGRGVRVARFDFPFMRRAREEGARRPPDRMPVLLDAWRAAAAGLGGGDRLFVGGKSMGGRAASIIADEIGARGLLCLGYPFHPPGRPDRPRTSHLAALRTPALFVQGTRDGFGSPEEVAGYELSPAIRLHWIEDGDHSLVPRARAGRSREEAMAEAVAAAAGFLEGR